MRMSLTLAATAMAFGCAAPGGPRVGEEITLEVESFRLKDAGMEGRAGAGGGKGVVFRTDAARAESSVRLEPGVYEVALFVHGPDSEHDAVHLSVAGEAYRVYPAPEDRGKVRPVQQLITFRATEPAAYPVVLEAAETGVFLDRVVLKRVR